MMHRPIARLAGAALAFAPALLAAQTNTLHKVVTLGGHQMTMTAQSLVVAADNISNARHSTPVSPAYNGIGSVDIRTTAGRFICTGSLLEDGKTVLTAAHCVSNLPGTVTSMSVNFYPNGATAVNIAASSWKANPLYSGQVIDENDVGVIHLVSEAPANISRYGLATTSGENSNFEFVGFGQKGSNGAGVSINAGFSLANRKQGANTFDITAGDARWQGFWDDPKASTSHVLLTDFDNGTTGYNSNDGMCWIGQYIATLNTTECNNGLGLNEADTGGGDSGGPGFVNGLIASVTSFGLTFGTFGPGPYPDPGYIQNPNGSRNYLNSSFGEFAGFADASFNSPWIMSELDLASLDPTVAGPVVTPEPASLVLVATGLLGVGGIVRRRRAA